MRIEIEPGGFATVGGLAIVNASPFPRAFCTRRRTFEAIAAPERPTTPRGDRRHAHRARAVESRRHEPRDMVS